MTTPEKSEASTRPEKSVAWRTWLIGAGVLGVLLVVAMSSAIRHDPLPARSEKSAEECGPDCFEARLAERRRQQMAEDLDDAGLLD